MAQDDTLYIPKGVAKRYLISVEVECGAADVFAPTQFLNVTLAPLNPPTDMGLQVSPALLQFSFEPAQCLDDTVAKTKQANLTVSVLPSAVPNLPAFERTQLTVQAILKKGATNLKWSNQTTNLTMGFVAVMGLTTEVGAGLLAGGKISFPVAVANQANGQARITVRVTSNPHNLTIALPEPFLVEKGASKSVSVNVTSSDCPVAERPFTVVANMSSTDTRGTDTVERTASFIVQCLNEVKKKSPGLELPVLVGTLAAFVLLRRRRPGQTL